MKIQPYKKYPTPVYPTRLAVLSEPDLLRKYMPPTWRKTAQMASLAAFFLGVNGCVNNPTLQDNHSESLVNSPTVSLANDSTSQSEARPNSFQPKSDRAAVVAPIFEHGNGRGSVGCVMTTPPVFLSEEEALQIIAEELADLGIDVSQKKVVLDSVVLPPAYSNPDKNSRKSIPFEADLVDTIKEIAIEYVSERDCFSLEEDTGLFSSVTLLPFKEVAQYINDQVKNRGKGLYFAAFYDPFVSISEEERKDLEKNLEIYADDWREVDNTNKEKSKRLIQDLMRVYEMKTNALIEEKKLESKRLLRLQVKDFTEWLKGQGVI